jgi:hypothetical protein
LAIAFYLAAAVYTNDGMMAAASTIAGQLRTMTAIAIATIGQRNTYTT